VRTLTESLRAHLGDPSAGSFQLMGEDLGRLTGADVALAGEAYRAALEERVPAALRAAFEVEQADLARVTHQWLRRYNRHLFGRVEGYLALGRLVRLEYPWPIVAILGIGQVQSGLLRMRAFGLAGRAVARLGLSFVERATDGVDDMLRRTNRGIFADSVPTVLYALRCHDLRVSGQEALARALLEGPLLPAMDEESRELAVGLFDGFGVHAPEERFRCLAALTRRHFAREQAIFTHQMGGRRTRAPEVSSRPLARWLEGRWLNEPRRVAAPAIVGHGRRRRLEYRAYALPAHFDMRDHEARVSAFDEAYVRSVTGSLEDYELAARYAHERFARAGSGGSGDLVTYPPGGLPPTDPASWEGGQA
jgi:hypothetical protein